MRSVVGKIRGADFIPVGVVGYLIGICIALRYLGADAARLRGFYILLCVIYILCNYYIIIIQERVEARDICIDEREITTISLHPINLCHCH